MEGIKILVVEDEKKIADTLKLGLTEQGFSTEVAYDGKIGYLLFQSEKFDIVILDINLPEMNGYELCKAIRRQNQHMAVIMLTAMSSIENKIEGYDAGADDYIIKPFEFRELLLKIKVLLKRTAYQPEPVGSVLKASDLEMNLDTKEVFRAGRKINLTLKEFQVLEYLMRNKNRMVSRADLSLNVWEADFNSNTNVIDVYISYVRSKVDKDFDHRLIQTHIGMGYILKEKGT
jgi:two-component system copper resistance phosphate regulon response regulator CusR